MVEVFGISGKYSGRKAIDRRAIVCDIDRREELVQLADSELATAKPGDTVGEMAAHFADTLLRSAEKVVPSSARQSRVQGWFEDAAIRAEFDHAWMTREEARAAMRVGPKDGHAWKNLRKACRKSRDVIQAGMDSYLDVYARDLEGYIQAGDMRGWYGHLKGGWRLQGRKIESEQYIGTRRENSYGKPTRSVSDGGNTSKSC